MNKWHFFIVALLLSIGTITCSSDSDNEIEAALIISSGKDNNHKLLSNHSSGNYYSLVWDFGNGETASTTNKTKVYEIYYPKAGNYTVTLTIANEDGRTSNATEVVMIETDDPDYVDDGLIWSDEFDATSIDTDKWTFEVGTGNNGWGNNELQYYTNGNNAELKDGKLVITARKVNDDKTVGSYTSTRMISWKKQEFTYGRVEVRAKLPSGTGIWPAIWMLGANIDQVGWPACGEIDIMEYVGYQPNMVHATVHNTSGHADNAFTNSISLASCEEQFHVYGLIWTADRLEFYIDSPDNITHTYVPSPKNGNNWPFDKPHFLILNVAVGGNWGGAQGIDNSIFPQSLEIDYVRVYKPD